MKTSVVVSYCSLDKRFIQSLVKEVSKFSNDIIIVYFDKLLNGIPEPVDEVKSLLSHNTTIKYLELQYIENTEPRYFHNLARWEGLKEAKHENILFLDADEIPEGDTMKSVLDRGLLDSYDAVDFACHWYFRSAKNRAVQKEECGLLVKKSIIKKDMMFTQSERWSFRTSGKFRYLPRAQTQNGPFMHHFSWVRTKEEMLTKVSAWGHKNDKNWASLIEEEFSRDFNGKDFVHGYRYDQVEDTFALKI
jgi:hypothetical protein